MAEVTVEPGSRCVPVTPSNTVPLNQVATAANRIPYARKILVTVTGDVALKTTGGDSFTLTGVAANVVIDCVAVQYVLATGTTATVRAIF